MYIANFIDQTSKGLLIGTILGTGLGSVAKLGDMVGNENWRAGPTRPSSAFAFGVLFPVVSKTLKVFLEFLLGKNSNDQERKTLKDIGPHAVVANQLTGLTFTYLVINKIHGPINPLFATIFTVSVAFLSFVLLVPCLHDAIRYSDPSLDAKAKITDTHVWNWIAHNLL